MALKATVTSLSEVPEAFRTLYTQTGDVYVLDVDDSDYKKTISEFRNNNIELNRQLEGLSGSKEELAKLQKQFAGLDPEAAKEALSKMKGIEEQTLIDAGKIDELVAKKVADQTERMRADFEGQTQALQTNLQATEEQLNNYRSKLTDVTIDSSLQSAISKVAMPKKGAMRDIIARGKEIWTLDDSGAPVPMREGKVMYGKDGKDAISMEEWAQTLVYDASYLFEPNSGGGANGNDAGGVGTGGSVSASDQDSLNNNIEKIASGEIQVQ